MNLTNNAMATVLLCSRLNSKAQSVTPFSTKEWNLLAEKLLKSLIQEPGNLLGMNKLDIKGNLNLNDDEADRVCNLLSRGANIAFALDDLEKKSIYITTRSDSNYPCRLRKILGKNAPPLLYYCGNLELASQNSVAIVGSRNIDSDGEKFARRLAEKSADEGYAVCSGGAKGVDQISETAALDKNGYCISFLADSMTRKLRQKNIRDAVISKRMLLISAVNPDAPFLAANAMSRNKYVYAMSQCAFVVASDYKKGGTWAGATENLKSGKITTYIWDNQKYRGNSHLIQMGGKGIADLEKLSITELSKSLPQVIQQLDFDTVSRTSKPLKPLTNSQLGIDDLICKSETSMNESKGIKEEKANTRLDKDSIYLAVLPMLLEYLDAPKSLDEIIGQFELTKKQTQEWLNRAVKEKVVLKASAPVKYSKADGCVK